MKTLGALAAGILCLAHTMAAPGGPRAAPTASERAALAGEVRSEFLHAWEAYKRDAWGHDELKPLSHTPKDWYAQSLWMTPIDALDTMQIMGLTEEAEKTKTAVLANLSFDKDVWVKNFEITIRILGGLLSAYQLTGDRRLLVLAGSSAMLPVLVDPENVFDIARGIREVLTDTALRESLIRRGLLQAAKFSWERAAREVLEVYREVAG